MRDIMARPGMVQYVTVDDDVCSALKPNFSRNWDPNGKVPTEDIKYHITDETERTRVQELRIRLDKYRTAKLFGAILHDLCYLYFN
jgi:hypothetical protein